MVSFIRLLWSHLLAATLRLRLRLLNVHPSPVPTDKPGIIVVQIDGLGFTVLQEAMKRGDAPFLRWLTHRGGYTLDSYFCGVPSITTAIVAELMYGKNENIPGYTWFHRTLGRFIRGDHGGQVKKLEETLFAGVTHPLMEGGSCIIGAYSGGATMTNISPDAKATKSRFHRLLSFRILLVPLLNPFRFWHIILVLAGSVVAMMLKALSKQSKKVFEDEFSTLLNRLFLCDLATTIAIIDIWRKTPAMYINLSLVDKVSHTHGIRHPIVFQSIRLMDLYCKKLYDSARGAERSYKFIVLSDHGQSPGIPFEKISGETLTHIITQGLGDKGPNVLLTYGNDHDLKENTSHDTVYAIPSSSITHLYFSRWLPAQANQKTIEHDFPSLIPTLLSHPGIGWIMVKENDKTTHLLARNGDRAEFENGKVKAIRGKPIDDPEADILLKALARLALGHNNGDLVLFGGNWRGAWASFEPYWGTHGSFTGEMVKPFMLTNDPKLHTLLASSASMRDLFKRIRGMRR